MRHLHRTIGFTLGVAGLVLAAALPVIAAWELAHGDPANTGFVDVLTSPAGRGLQVTELGTFAFGAGPVVAPDGTVYLGTVEGKVIALHADGSPFWSREITQGQSIVSSPAVGADGTVYVVGTKRTVIRDHRGETVITRTVFETMLHRFTAGGGWIGQTPFPDHGDGGRTTAAPNILRIGSVEVVLVPVIYDNCCAGHDVRLAGFSTSGAVVIDQRVAFHQGSVIGGSGRPRWMDWSCLVPVIGWPVCLEIEKYHPPPSDPPPTPALPSVAVFTPGAAGAPLVIVSDQVHDIVGYTFSSNVTLIESFRFHDEAHALNSTPVVLPDGQILMGTAGAHEAGIVRTGPDGIKRSTVAGLGTVYGAPTRTVRGRVVVIGFVGNGQLSLLLPPRILSQRLLLTPSYVSAAASRTHVFVSTQNSLITFDRDGSPLLSSSWVGGGMSPPAIGPQGHVYAIASNILFVFPPPRG